MTDFILTVEEGEEGYEYDLKLLKDIEVDEDDVILDTHTLVHKEITGEGSDRMLFDSLCDEIGPAVTEEFFSDPDDDRVRLN